jgi:hypothetical protein
MAATNQESAVRLYLLYLEDPEKLRDQAEVTKKAAAVQAAKDPVEKLLALAALADASTVDGETYRNDFIAHAKEWADENHVPATAFRELGVSDDDLRQAGFELPARRGRGSGPRPSTRGSSGRARARSVSVEQLKEHIATMQGTFLLSDVMEQAGGSPATVRKAVEDLVASGGVERLGPVADHHGRGRAPIQYAVSGQG